MNNLLTEVLRIQEILGYGKSIISEGAIGNIVGKSLSDAVEKQIATIIRKEVLLALRNGVKQTTVYTKNTAANIEKEVLERAGLKILTGPQKAGLKAEAIRIAKEEAEKLSKKQTGTTAKKETAVTAAQNINKNFNKNTVEVIVKLEGKLPGIKNASKTGSKTVKTSKGRTKNLERPALSEKQVLEVNTAVRNGATEQIVVEGRRGFKSWANWVKWGKRIGIGAGVLWLLFYFMSDDATPVPDDITPTPTPPSPNPESSNYRDCNSVEFLSQGCKSEKIKDLQTCIGFTGRDVDGLWGDKTQARMVELGLATGILVSDIEGICNSYNQIKTGSNADLESSREKLQNRQQNRTFSGEEGPYADYDAASTSSPSTQPSGTNSTEGPTAEY